MHTYFSNNKIQSHIQLTCYLEVQINRDTSITNDMHFIKQPRIKLISFCPPTR